MKVFKVTTVIAMSEKEYQRMGGTLDGIAKQIEEELVNDNIGGSYNISIEVTNVEEEDR